eukprot:6829519-Ditylum_brightwellii.AAC.1
MLILQMRHSLTIEPLQSARSNPIVDPLTTDTAPLVLTTVPDALTSKVPYKSPLFNLMMYVASSASVDLIPPQYSGTIHSYLFLHLSMCYAHPV